MRGFLPGAHGPSKYGSMDPWLEASQAVLETWVAAVDVSPGDERDAVAPQDEAMDQAHAGRPSGAAQLSS